MAEKIKLLVEEQLKCPVCHGILEDARMLECGHSYCKECIGAVIKSTHRLGGRINCPYCRQEVSIQSGSGALKQNWIANNILQVLAKSEKKEEEPVQEETCAIHPENEEDYYCDQCGIIVCSHCAISDHFNHGAPPKKFGEIVEIIKERIGGFLEKADLWDAQHFVYEDTIVDIQQVGSQALEMVEGDILQEYNARLKQLNQSRDRLLDHVTKWKDSFSGFMDKLLLIEREYRGKVKQCRILAHCKVDNGTDKNVVEFFKEWSEELDRNLSYDVPDTEDAESHLTMVRGLYFEKHPICASESAYLDIGFIGHHLESDELNVEGEDGQDMPELDEFDDAPQDLQVTVNQLVSELQSDVLDLDDEPEVTMIDDPDSTPEQSTEHVIIEPSEQITATSTTNITPPTNLTLSPPSSSSSSSSLSSLSSLSFQSIWKRAVQACLSVTICFLHLCIFIIPLVFCTQDILHDSTDTVYSTFDEVVDNSYQCGQNSSVVGYKRHSMIWTYVTYFGENLRTTPMLAYMGDIMQIFDFSVPSPIPWLPTFLILEE